MLEVTDLKFNIFLRDHLKNDVFLEVFYFDKKLKIDLGPSKDLKEQKDFSVIIYKENNEIGNFKIKYLSYPFLFSVYDYYDYKKFDFKRLKKELIDFINYFPIFLSDSLIHSFNIIYKNFSNYTLSSDFNIKGLNYEIFPQVKIHDSSNYLEPANNSKKNISERKINYIFRDQILTTLSISDLLNFYKVDKFYINSVLSFLKSFEFTPFLTENKLGFFLFIPEISFVYFLYFDNKIKKYKVLNNNSQIFTEFILGLNFDNNYHFENELKNCIKINLKNNEENLKFFIQSCIKNLYLSPILKEILSYNEYTELEYKISLTKIINY